MTNTEILQQLKENKQFKDELLDVLLSDNDFVLEIATNILTVPVSKLGIPSPGTLSEFILECASDKTDTD